jgi:hypothetical protein
MVKLDRILTTGVDADPARQALAAALVNFAAATGAKVIAEGIETAGELDVIRQLGIDCGQGYFLGRPGPVTQLTSSPEAPPVLDRDHYSPLPSQGTPQPGGLIHIETQTAAASTDEAQSASSAAELASDGPRVSWLQLTAWARLFSALRNLRQADSSLPAAAGVRLTDIRDEPEVCRSEFLTVEALADEIGVPIETLQRWRKAGYGPAAIASDDNCETRFVRRAVEQWRSGNQSTINQPEVLSQAGSTAC